jgi:hypothetical protein
MVGSAVRERPLHEGARIVLDGWLSMCLCKHLIDQNSIWNQCMPSIRLVRFQHPFEFSLT